MRLAVGPAQRLRRRVLLVEDDDGVRLSLARYLTAAGYDVVPVADADRAFVVLEHSSVDAVITDVRLGPHRSGLEVLEFVGLDHREDRNVLTIVLTGVTLTEAFQLVPEQSTAAMIVHHPEAKYFSV